MMLPVVGCRRQRVTGHHALFGDADSHTDTPVAGSLVDMLDPLGHLRNSLQQSGNH